MESPVIGGPTNPDPGAHRFGLADFAMAALVLPGLVGVALVLVARGGVYFSQWVPEMFIPLEGVLHLRAGQWPHRDFVTPVGSLWYAINALPGLFMPICARVVVWANLIVALVAAMAALIVCLGKMPRWLAGLCAFYAGLVALSPRQIGEGIQHISNNASYNRYCWALICVIALAALLPAPGRRREWADGVVAGVLIALCFYIKVTYAAAGIGFLGLGLVTVRGLSGWRFVGIAVAVALATVLIAGLVTGDLPGYLADMHTAVAVLPDTARSHQARGLVVVGLPGLMLAGALALIAGAPPGRLFGRFGPDVWAGVLTAAAGVAIGIQNHPELENPLLPVAVLIGWTVTRARISGPARFSDGFGRFVLCACLLIPVATDLASVGWTMIAPLDAGPSTRWLSGTHVTDLRIGARFAGPDLSRHREIPQGDAQILDRLDEALGLLRPHLHDRHDAIVLPFIWTNPFPLLLGLPPVRHEAAWWDAERTFNTLLRPDPRLLLNHVDFVLVPHDYATANLDTEKTMANAYGPQVHRDFRAIGHTPHWDLWARQDCARRSLC